MSIGPTTPVFAEARTAKVAGAFYPADPEELRSFITAALSKHPAPAADSPKPRILILPHAGYPYSGVVAARGVREVQARTYEAVVVVGFTHNAVFEGASVDDREAYRTPLGEIPVDRDAVAFLVAQPGLHHVEEAHASSEHSLEVMLPLLQVAFGEFRLIPVLMGGASNADADALAHALAALAGRGDYLFVFSTDLSHYHPYDDAVRRDQHTLQTILLETPEAVHQQFVLGHLEACGRGPILTSRFLAKQLGYLQPRLLLYANSGDTAGDKSRVVGYAAIGMYDSSTVSSDDLISPEAGRALVAHARGVLQVRVGSAEPGELVPLSRFPELTQTRGMFVTLRKKTGELRGCIGRIESEVPLAQLLPVVALDAALRDSRFTPLRAEELDDITVEVSVLSPPRPIRSAQEIVPGRDGVVLQHDGHGGVFLPQVWDETGWTRVEFLRELASQKAGLPPDAWQTAQLSVFQDQAFGEHDSTD